MPTEFYTVLQQNGFNAHVSLTALFIYLFYYETRTKVHEKEKRKRKKNTRKTQTIENIQKNTHHEKHITWCMLTI